MADGTRNMTVGSPAGHLIRFALPLLAGSFLQQLYNMVDSFVVGRYVGDAALAAVGVGFPVLFMFTSLFTGLANGGTVVIAQLYGAGELQRVRDAVDTIYTAFLLSVLPVTLAAVALVKPLLVVLRVDASVWQDAWLYLTVVCAGLIGTIGYNLNAGILGGLGNSRSTLLFLSIAAILNIILDFALVLWAGMGVLGVALATIFSQAVSWVFGIVFINRRYPQIAIRPFPLRFDRDLFRQIMGVGLPAGIQMSLVALGSMVIMSKVNSFGEAYTAGYNAGYRMDQLAFLPIQSVASAATAFVGQNMGARLPQRARQGIRSAVAASVVWSLLMAAILMPAAPRLIALFSRTPAVIDAGAAYLWSIMPFYVFFAVFFTLNSAMRGAGESVFPMLNTIFSLILLRAPSLYLIADRFGPDFMYLGFGVGWLAGFFITVGYYRSGRWMRRGSLADQVISAPKS